MGLQAVERVEYNHRAFAKRLSYVLFGAFFVIAFFIIYTPYSELHERRYYYKDVEAELPLPHLYFCPISYTTHTSPAELDADFWVDSYEDSSFVRLSCEGIEYTVDGIGNQGELCEEGQAYQDRAVSVRTVKIQDWGTCFTVDLTGFQVVGKAADVQVEILFNASYHSQSAQNASLGLSSRMVSVMAVAADNNQAFLDARYDGVSQIPMTSDLLAGSFDAHSHTMGICRTRTNIRERFTYDEAFYLGLSRATEDTLYYTFDQSTGQLYSPGSVYALDNSASANVLPYEDTEVILQSFVFDSTQVRYLKEYNPIHIAFIVGLIGGVTAFGRVFWYIFFLKKAPEPLTWRWAPDAKNTYTDSEMDTFEVDNTWSRLQARGLTLQQEAQDSTKQLGIEEDCLIAILQQHQDLASLKSLAMAQQEKLQTMRDAYSSLLTKVKRELNTMQGDLKEFNLVFAARLEEVLKESELFEGSRSKASGLCY